MKNRIFEILKTVLELEQVDETLSSANCEKWDSMAQLNISVEIEAEFGISLEPEEIAEMASYNDIMKILKAKGI